MRPKLFIATCAWTVFAVLAFHVVSPVVTYAAQEITIPAGTVVTIRTIDDIHPRDKNIGDRVILKVVSDVKIDGKVVIAAGATVRGEISAAKEQGVAGVNAKIGLSVRSVEAVDGTTIALYGTKLAEGSSKTTQSVILTIFCCILFLLMKGKDASIPSGTIIDSEVAGTAKVMVE